MPPYDRMIDAAAGKSSTWPAGEPQEIRDLADAKQAAARQQGGSKFAALRRALRRIGEAITGRPDHVHDYRPDFWGGYSCWCSEPAPEGTVPS